MPSTRRHSYDLNFKLKIVAEAEAVNNNREIAREYGISQENAGFCTQRRPGWTKKVCYFSFIVFGVFNSGHDNFIERFVVTFASFRESEVRNLFNCF